MIELQCRMRLLQPGWMDMRKTSYRLQHHFFLRNGQHKNGAFNTYIKKVHKVQSRGFNSDKCVTIWELRHVDIANFELVVLLRID